MYSSFYSLPQCQKVLNAMPWLLYSQKRALVHILQDARLAPGLILPLPGFFRTLQIFKMGSIWRSKVLVQLSLWHWSYKKCRKCFRLTASYKAAWDMLKPCRILNFKWQNFKIYLWLNKNTKSFTYSLTVLKYSWLHGSRAIPLATGSSSMSVSKSKYGKDEVNFMCSTTSCTFFGSPYNLHQSIYFCLVSNGNMMY